MADASGLDMSRRFNESGRVEVTLEKPSWTFNGWTNLNKTFWNVKALHDLSASFDFSELSCLVFEEMRFKVNLTLGGFSSLALQCWTRFFFFEKTFMES